MWPFDKKKSSEKESPIKVNTIICIPGTWKSWEEFIVLIVASSGGKYLAVGNTLFDVQKNLLYEITFCEHDPQMKQAFTMAGMVTRITEESLQSIGEHKSVIYISGPGGSMENAENIAYAAAEVVKAGGLAVKIETAGKGFSKERWLDFFTDFKPTNLFSMFVIESIGDTEHTFSCGMHNLGYRDTIISGEEFQQSAYLIFVFSFYQLVDKPQIVEGQTFSVDMESPRFRITEEKNPPYGSNEELFGNPFGMWRLSKV